MKTRIMLAAMALAAVLGGCVTYLGKPETPKEDRVELALDGEVTLYQFDDQVFTLPLQGTIVFTEGWHDLYVRFARAYSSGHVMAQTDIRKIGYAFAKGKRYQLNVEAPRLAPWGSVNFYIVEAP